jgi:hypothetical protein
MHSPDRSQWKDDLLRDMLHATQMKKAAAVRLPAGVGVMTGRELATP